jgi:hypothetical protein
MRLKIKDPKYAKRHLYGFHIPEFYYVEGEPCETPRWVDYEAVSLRYGPGRYEFRIIDSATIVEVDGEHQSARPVSRTRREIKVTGDTGKPYMVVLDGTHTSCSCTGFQFRKTCKHIGLARTAA